MLAKKKFNKNQMTGIASEADLAHDKGYCLKDSTENYENDPKGARMKAMDHTGFVTRSHYSTERN